MIMTKWFEKIIYKKIKNKGYVKYSVYEKNINNEYVLQDLNNIATKGKVKFVQKADPFFGCGENYESQYITNPTWLDVSILANDMIHTTKDKQHIFLEGIIRNENTVYFKMGS